MARSPIPRLFLVLLSALALVLVGMESAAGQPTCPSVPPAQIGECWWSSVNCAAGCSECWFMCECCIGGGGYWNGPFAVSDCSGPQPPCGGGDDDGGGGGSPPTGWLDAASCTYVNGWACDPDISGPINVDIYVDGLFKISVLANDPGEAAIDDFCDGTTHRWHWDVQPSQYFGLGLHTVNAYPIGVDSGGTPNGENPELSGSPKSPTCTGEWHCCDLRAVNPPGLWYPDPPVCALIGSDCILDPAVYNFCGLGAGDYETRSFWPSPPDAIQQSATTPYWCIAPANDASMDPGAGGAVTPCDQNTDCTASGNCYDTGNVDADRDGDTDSDYCLNGTWYDCLADAQCIGGYHCSSNNCIPNTEIDCNNGIDDDGDTLIDEKDPDCCSWCESNGNWGWALLGGSCAGATVMFWEDPGLQNQSCCGNSPDEAYEICEYLDLPGNDKVSWASSCTSDDDGCCLSPGCVDPAANVCYDASFGYDIPSQSSSDSFSYCNAGGVWQDCDNSSSICGGCAGVAGFPCTGGASCWANGGESAAFGEYDTGTATECCGDDPSEYFNRSIYHPSIESPPPATVACCNALTDCVNGSACYTNVATADVDSNGDADVCSAGTWLDCNIDAQCGGGLCCNAANNCSTCDDETGKCNDGIDNDDDGYTDYDDPDCCSWCEDLPNAWFDSNAPGPETPVGCGSPFSMWELGEGFQQQWCCGNNVTTEFYKVYFDNPSTIACCNATTDCVDALGTCRIGSEFSPGGCTDPYDHDCDGKNNYDDEDCLATLSGIVTDDEDTPIENATVTAVGWDPITEVSVNFTYVTPASGEYAMDVIVNLTYDIVVKVPGYGTGFEWNQSVGDDGRTIDFKIKKAENCEDDCTSPGENWCRPDCWGVNNCEYFNPITFGVCADGVQKDWILPIPGTDSEVQCCDGAPVQRKRTQIVGISGAESVVRVTRIISYAGQLITLVIDVFK